MPAAAGEPDHAAAAAAADTGGAQPADERADTAGAAAGVGEAALAGWIAAVIGHYEYCRARVEAIARWDALSAQTRPTTTATATHTATPTATATTTETSDGR